MPETLVETAPNPTEGQSAPAAGTPTTPVEGKPAEQPAPAVTSLLTEPEAKPAGEKPPPAAPEKYEFVAPEGEAYDPQVLEEFSSAAKEADLTQDAAQKLIAKMAPALAARQQAQVAAVQQEWVAASTADKEIGGDKLQENLAIAQKAMTTFATPALWQLFKNSGLGNHPEMLRMLVHVGKAISEDGYVGRSSGPATVNMADWNSIADALYPPKG